jgi:hypothetical protein
MGAAWLWTGGNRFVPGARGAHPDWSVKNDFRWTAFARNQWQALVQLLVQAGWQGSDSHGWILDKRRREDSEAVEGLYLRTRCASSKSARMPTRIFQGLKGAKVFAAEEVLAVLDNWLQADEEWA